MSAVRAMVARGWLVQQPDELLCFRLTPAGVTVCERELAPRVHMPHVITNWERARSSRGRRAAAGRV